ncbi:MAG TPA: RagB/SusD family nutrient uptake outer membrane protein, partial [Bacteroidales bacterium]|nr:RagB/SusD family nutrient uptake outer membrane protein [Bacteroidales bacterium]
MKNRLFIVSILALSLFATTACTNWLDTRPESEMILDEYWTTESEAEAVLMAAYRGFITSDCTYRMLVWGELRSDNFTQGTGIGDEINKVLRQEITPSTPYTTWSSFYSVINYCNTFLSFAPDVLKKDDNFTVEKLRKLSAEAYAVRALAYFYLVRAFQNVPWISEPSLDDTQDFIVPQFSERAVLDSIIRDLELYSLPYIPRIHSTDKETKGRFTKNGVYALLADIYLWDNQFEKCSQMCDYILADDYYTLVPAENFYSQVFYTGFSSESIFEFGYDNNIQVNDATRSLYGYQNNQNGQLAFPVTLVSGQYSPFEYPAGSYIESKNDVDIRWKDFFVNDPGVGVYQIFKYAGIQRTENFDGSR